MLFEAGPMHEAVYHAPAAIAAAVMDDVRTINARPLDGVDTAGMVLASCNWSVTTETILLQIVPYSLAWTPNQPRRLSGWHWWEALGDPLL